jgi:type IV secretory pathway protease TraF
MSLQPDTDQQLAKTSGRLAANGAKLFGVAAVLAIVGAVLLITDASTVAGLFCVGLALPVTIGALMLTGSGAVGKRASEQKDFA